MKFEWNEDKRQENLKKHGIDFKDAHDIFNHPMKEELDLREDYGEDRWIVLGLMYGQVVYAVYTERDDGQTIRFISIRKALKNEREKYYQDCRNYE